ncbi:MAG TPA: gluconate 2-dehydrogenase subunit 3 family protein [Bryobacteraceae bacterium]|nr:gluconate 2-dehydrogenase subunit 3 family protein [Bryobacteraceae bacterium]
MADKKQPEPVGPSVSRRDMFNIIGSVPVLAAVTAGTAAARPVDGHAHTAHKAQAAPAAKGPYVRQTFDERQWKTVRVLCDLIIPADDHSGSASQAGVPEFLDDWLAFRTKEDGNENLRAQILGGLMWLDRESRKLAQTEFASAPVAQQKQILDRVAYPKRAAKEDHNWVVFFNQFRSLTVSGFYSSKMGVGDLPYLGNVAVAEWKGCDPKVWAIIEERQKNGYKGILEAKPWATS